MVDRLSPEARSRLMGRVRHRGTALEITLRKALWADGWRYRLRSKVRLPGSPDIVFPRAKVAIFVDGCFWHGCPLHGTLPQTRPEFWAAKIARNRERDAEVDAKLTVMGWISVRIWEHQIRSALPDILADVESTLQSRVRQQDTMGG